MSLSVSRKNYNKAYELYNSIDQQWNKLETGNSMDPEYDINKLFMDLSSIRKYINGVNVDDFVGVYDDDRIVQILKNLDYFQEAQYHIERNTKAIKYADELPTAVSTYIENMNLSSASYSYLAKDLNELTKKFIATITNKTNILDYENEIKRMMKGKMSQKEFEKIYNVLKRGIIRRPRSSFESLQIYFKKENLL